MFLLYRKERLAYSLSLALTKKHIDHDIKHLGVAKPRASPPSGGDQYSPVVGCGRGILIVE
jgi:hypothetical protein